VYPGPVSAQKAIVVLHGITMSGSSMLRTLGPLGARLTELGFELVAPNAAHRLAPDELAELVTMFEERYSRRRTHAADWFSAGRFWDSGEHFDWFAASTDSGTGTKTYRALTASLAVLGDAVRDRNVVGLLGFSQGAAMATIVAALASRGDPRFEGLRFGIFVSGFKPVFTAPDPPAYPVPTTLARLYVAGGRDPIFPGTEEYLASLGAAFEGGSEERLLIAGLSHEVPSAPLDVGHIARFAVRHAADDRT